MGTTKNAAAARQRVEAHLRAHLDAMAEATADGLAARDQLEQLREERVALLADLELREAAAQHDLEVAASALRTQQQTNADIAALLDVHPSALRPRRNSRELRGTTVKDLPAPPRAVNAPAPAPSEGRAS